MSAWRVCGVFRLDSMEPSLLREGISLVATVRKLLWIRIQVGSIGGDRHDQQSRNVGGDPGQQRGFVLS